MTEKELERPYSKGRSINVKPKPEGFPQVSAQNKIHRYLLLQSKAFAAMSSKANKYASEESVHQLRIFTRRTRAALWILLNSSEEKVFKTFDHRLEKLGHRLGRVRELDVALQDANHFHLKSSALKRLRKKAQKKMRQHLNFGQTQKIKNGFSLVESAIQIGDPVSLTNSWKSLLDQLQHQVKRDANGKIKLHQLRVVIKKVRYTLEVIGSSTVTMEPLLEILGDAHDLEFLQTIVGKNKKVRTAYRKLNTKAVELIKPVLHSALDELSGNLTH